MPAITRCWTKHAQQRVILTLGVRREEQPTYSPELNLQEDIWQHMRRRVTHNHYIEELDALLETVDQFYEQSEQCLQQVLYPISKWSRFIST